MCLKALENLMKEMGEVFGKCLEKRVFEEFRRR